MNGWKQQGLSKLITILHILCTGVYESDQGGEIVNF